MLLLLLPHERKQRGRAAMRPHCWSRSSFVRTLVVDLLLSFDLLSSSPISLYPPFNSSFAFDNRRYFRGDVGSYKLVEAQKKKKGGGARSSHAAQKK